MKTLTSEQSPIRIVPITPETAAGGWLAISLAPGKKTLGTSVRWERDLDADLDRLVALGVTTLVPLLVDDEMERLGISGLAPGARRRELGLFPYPIPDGAPPADLDDCMAFVGDLVKRQDRGERLLVHCNGGLGRAGTVAACVLVAASLADSADAAIAEVRFRRSRRAIETSTQEAFVSRFFDCWRALRPRPRAGEAARRTGAWLGLVIGDALGAPVEFMGPAVIRERHGCLRDMIAGGPWLRGEWTDDTALAIAAAQAYGPGRFDLGEAARAMVAWLESDPKDVGMQTRRTLAMLRDGGDPRQVGHSYLQRHPGAAGNGSLMRAAPTGLVRPPLDPRLAAESAAISALTHADSRCTGACIAFNAALSALVHAGPDVDAAMAAARQASQGGDEQVRALIDGVAKRAPALYQDAPIGYVLLCLERALLALRDADSFEGGLIDVVNQGGDTDTNAAVAGALLGARFGPDGLPDRWLSAIRTRRPVCAALDRIRAFASRQPH